MRVREHWNLSTPRSTRRKRPRTGLLFYLTHALAPRASQNLEMIQTTPTTAIAANEDRRLWQRIAQAKALLEDGSRHLRNIAQDEVLKSETPMEVETAMELAARSINEAIHCLEHPQSEKASPNIKGRPTRQQGQFLAFIREYMKHNYSGVAPTHAEFQRFFNLTPPSVNSMLVRLEQRAFIRRIPGKARAIELVINPDWIPQLERPFKF